MSGGFEWPKDKHDKPIPTVTDPLTGSEMCQSCWNGAHSRNGCGNAQCMCGCYLGRVDGLRRVHKPHPEVDTLLPDEGGIYIG